MRELKFRCWNNWGKCFHDMAELVEKQKMHLFDNKDSCYTMEEYIGLQDIDDNQICENDICEVMYYTPFGDKTNDFYGKWLVTKWMGMFILLNGKERVSFTDFANVTSSEYVSNLGTVCEFSTKVNVRVIGNIHQNTELLNEQTNP